MIALCKMVIQKKWKHTATGAWNKIKYCNHYIHAVCLRPYSSSLNIVILIVDWTYANPNRFTFSVLRARFILKLVKYKRTKQIQSATYPLNRDQTNTQNARRSGN